ncbi:hypothetical protein LV89_01012 [Arcicella aurantiaca]|uniref:Tubulin-like protein n=1 Tax=Arcicella aurantiaca TaxID=591202 RepID=A0A316ECM4_9BACT|nr:hypothetical protein [Arcicella aurantiaca]PWK28231.1 hypothetical protein LV89_01012 [Arcicella aurantiaca]
MSNLYIFAVGGTGSRVVKALTMLLASGVEMNNTNTIIPIIVDPHRGNKDLQRTENVLKEYQEIRNSLVQQPQSGDFFCTKIATLKDMVDNADLIASSYIFELKGVANEKFKDYIDFASLDDSNKALASLLFSEKNLDTEMDIGFVGNPNIGSVVLNQFKESNEFQYFASNFKANDRIFIISSIFGGTGAAGFPIILKNIRGATNQVPNSSFLNNAIIGAVSVMPYFGVLPSTDKTIDKATFISKTKSALQYYTKGVNPSVNKMYYIGEAHNKDYQNDPGEGGQKNDAHFVEMAAALSIVDFMNTPDAMLQVNLGQPTNPTFSEFAIKNDTDPIKMTDISAATNRIISLPLSKMTFMKKYMDAQISKSLGNVSWSKSAPTIDKDFTTGSFYKTLESFLNSYKEWLIEMGRNQRAFQPFLLGNESLADTINQVKPSASSGLKSFFTPDVDFNSFDEFLTKENKKEVSFVNAEVKFLSLFNKGTQQLLKERFFNLFS